MEVTSPIHPDRASLVEPAIKAQIAPGPIEITQVKPAESDPDYSVHLRQFQSGAPPRVRSIKCKLTWNGGATATPDSGWTVTVTDTGAWRS